VLKLLNMLEFFLITVMYKRKSKFWYLTHSELNSCKDIFIKNLQGGTFAFAHLFLQI
jgi:hypothetical protein